MSNMIPAAFSPELTMTSVEIAELTGKRHDHVVRDLKTLEKQAVIDLPRFGEIEKDAKNRNRTIYRLPQRETLILTSGYSAKQRAAIIDRWMELEQAQPNLTMGDILIQQAQAFKALEAKQAEIDERTKRIEARQEMMEKGFHDFSVLAYSRYKEYPSLDIKTASELGRKAANLSRERKIPIGKIRDPRFGYINTYAEEILDEIFQSAFTL